MSKLTDEILNKYIDGELDNNEIRELKKIIAEDPESLEKLKAHKLVDEILRKLETEPAPANVTERVMNKISEVVSVKNKKSYFFISMVSILIIGMISVMVYALSTVEIEEGSNGFASTVLEKIENFVVQNTSTIESVVSDGGILLLGGFLTFILVVSGFFMVNTHKSVINKLNNY
jgi:hypothetical protein